MNSAGSIQELTRIPEKAQSSDSAPAPKPRRDPAACIFVGNMGHRQTDKELGELLRILFEPFGRILNIKVTRDIPSRPCAFIQFARREDAYRAIAGNQGSIVGGRSIRLERARVNKTLVVTPTSEVSPSVIEAKLQQASPTLILIIHNPFRAIARFATCDEAVNFSAVLKQDGFNVEFATSDLQRLAGLPADTEAVLELTNAPLPKRLPAQLAGLSVIVRNIAPEFCHYSKIRARFSTCGPVQSVHISQSGDSPGEALIIFANAEDLERALMESGNCNWCGNMIHIVPFDAALTWSRLVTAQVAPVAETPVGGMATALPWSVPMYIYPTMYSMNPAPGVPPMYPIMPQGIMPQMMAPMPVMPACQPSTVQPSGSAPIFAPEKVTKPEQVVTPEQVAKPQEVPKRRQIQIPNHQRTFDPSIARTLRYTPHDQVADASPFPDSAEDYFASKR